MRAPTSASAQLFFRASAIAIAAVVGAAAPAMAADEIINNQTVDSPPFVMNPTDNLIVGTDGTGVLNILSGTFIVNSAVLGEQAAGSGTINITVTGFGTGFGGPSAPVTIGKAGTGVLNAVGGGSQISIYTGTTTLGEDAGSNGSATLSGSGSGWIVDGPLMVGKSGDGTLNITDGADVIAGNNAVTLGANAGANGTLNISGSDSTLAGGSGGLTVGAGGNGTLNASDGAAITLAGFGTFGIGIAAGGTGTATFTGTGTSLTAYSVNAGGRGTGTLNILDGADVTSTAATVGGNIGADPASGTATVSGAGSTWTNGANDFQVGFANSNGTLNIASGGVVSTGGNMILGVTTTAYTGTVNIGGAGSKLEVGSDLTIGRGGAGVMNVTDGATVEADYTYIGGNTTGIGTLNISGSDTIWKGMDFTAGRAGNGALNITDGVKMTGSNAIETITIGYDTTGVGAVKISGPGTEVLLDDDIEWHSGTGSLEISDGAVVGADYLYGGGGAGGSTMLVTGAGTTLSVAFGAYIGYYGDMDAVFTDSATVNVTSATLNIGRYETAALTVSNGAQVNAQHNVLVGGDNGAVGTLILATGGVVTTPGTVTLASDAGSTGTLIFGAKEGDAAVAAGTLNAPTVSFGSGTGEIVFNHTSDLTFAAGLNGTGDIKVLSGTTTFTTSTSVYAGDIDVTGGKAVFDASIPSQVTVSGSGVVGGEGTVARLIAQSGGTVAPGNSPGTLHVMSHVTFEPGSIYAVEVDGAQSDLIDAVGVAELNGGTVQVSGSPALLQYTIITAGSGIMGTFDDVQSTSAFVKYTLDYDANNVYLLVSSVSSLTTAARTPNEFAVAKALDKFPAPNALYDAVAMQSAAGAQQAFNALSGEIHASVGSAMADDARYVREAITGRLIQSFYGGSGAGGGQAIALAAAAPTDVASLDSSSRMSLGAGYGAANAAPAANRDLAWWSRAFGAWGQYDSNGNAATTDRNMGGFVTGVDGNIGSGWRAGLATGYIYTGLSTGAGRHSSAEVNSYVLGGYAGGGIGAFALRSGGTWTWNDVDAKRSVIFPGFFENEKANYNGDVGQLFAELAYPVFTQGGVVEPFAGLAYVHVGTDGFTESGPVAGLTSGGQSMDVGYGTLGARAGTTVVWAGTTVIPHASLGWQYAFGDITPQQALAFASTGIGMGIGGVPLARNSALLEIGADAVVAPDMTLGLSYTGQYAGDFTDNGLRGRFNWKF